MWTLILSLFKPQLLIKTLHKEIPAVLLSTMHELVDQSNDCHQRVTCLRSMLTWPWLSDLQQKVKAKCLIRTKITVFSMLVKRRLIPGSPGCSGVCPQAENGLIHRIMVVDCPLVITSIGEALFHTRPDQERGIIGPPSLLHRTRCQIWCTIELHRDPISKVLLEW